MAKIRRVDFSPDEWLAGTRGLTFEERGAYWDVCALMYSRGGPIADDEAWLAKALSCHVRTWRTIRARLIAKGKLSLTDGMLCNERTNREIEKAESRLRNSREAAESSARERRLRAEERATDRREEPENDAQSNDYNDVAEAPASVSDEAITNHQPSTINHKKITAAVTEVSGALAEGSPAPKPDPKGTRLAEGWRPEGELRQWTIDRIASEGSTVSAGHELEKFQNYWRASPGAKGRKVDWGLTWRNWILKAIELEGNGNVRAQRPGQTNGRPANGGAPTVADGVTAAFARRSIPHGG